MRIYLLPIIFFLISLSSFTLNAQVYCTSAAAFTSDEDITNVSLGTLNNASACGFLAPGAGSSAFRYSNYTGNVTAPNLIQASSYSLSVRVTQCGVSANSGIVGVWIDFNQNGTFTDLGENVYMSPFTLIAVAGTTLSSAGGITIPANATPGITRMRVTFTESSTNPAPCTNPTWGEVEDYDVNIVAQPAFDMGVTALLKPLASKNCFSNHNDTIVTRIRNSGSNAINFATSPATISVISSGPTNSNFNFVINSGVLASNTSQDYTITTNYNMTVGGTYNLKAYTTFSQDNLPSNDTLTTTRSRIAFFSNTILPNDSVCFGQSVQLNSVYNPTFAVGTGTLINGSTGYPTAYGHFYGGARHQFLYLASELTAAGLVAGNINSIAFNATNLNGTDPLSNYNISMAQTTITAITSIQTSGFTTHFNSNSYDPIIGQNIHNFSNPFVWDGISNIIIETCFNNNDLGSNNVSVSQTNTSYVSSVWFRADINPNVCSTTTSSGTLARKPNVIFGQALPISYSWTPTTSLSNSSIANPIANPTLSTLYVVSAEVSGCKTSNGINITIKATPQPNLGNDTLICSTPYVLNTNTSSDNYLWNNNTTSSSNVINQSGKYWVRTTNNNGCFNSDTINISIGNKPVVELGADTGFCQGKTIKLYAGNPPGHTYLWNTGASDSIITVSSAGVYSVSVTNSSGCTTIDSVKVIQKTNPSVSLVFSGQTAFCTTDSPINLNGGSPTGGTYIGAGVNGTSFNPVSAGQGNYIITYYYLANNGCSNTAKDTLTVNACVGIEELSHSIDINLYPNPTKDYINLEINQETNDINIVFSSIEGKILISDVNPEFINNQYTLNLNDMAPGIYFLQVSGNNFLKTIKIIIQ
jgi:hypothetical protein